MLNICGPGIFKPLARFFKQFLDTGVLPCELKKGNIVHIHKKVTSKV